jgi:Kef-type K+ transport system membrane component KefB
MASVWFHSALWLGLALLASLISIRIAVSVALIEIVVGALAGNLVGLQITDWVNFLAGFGAILLTFLAGAEIDPRIVRKHFWSSITIGIMGFVAPYLGVLAYAHWGIGWDWPQAQIGGIALSTTSVAVVYAVMIETGFNRTEIGKIILAACFINDLGTVLARYAPRMFRSLGTRVSEPQTKFVALILLGLGGLASIAGSEAVLPAYLVGMTLAPTFLSEPELPHRMRIIAFSILTPFYFLKAGSLVEAHAVAAAFGLIAIFLGIKMATKFVGILPLTIFHEFDSREGMYTTLLMSTGLTFGSISALFGLTNKIIDQSQYTILVTAVIGSAVVPTLIAQKWFQPKFKAISADVEEAEAVAGEEP